MVKGERLRIALLGPGTIGRELIRQTINDPVFRYVALADTSGVITKTDAFTTTELTDILDHKKSGSPLKGYTGPHDYHKQISGVFDIEFDVLIDATPSQTYDTLMRALEHAHVLTANKVPVADVTYDQYQKLTQKAKNYDRTLDIGATVGAGLKIPNFLVTLGIDAIEKLSGCLSGTMNYVSQRVNQGTPLSAAVIEAMSPPRNYAEPDPRIDLAGDDFARKLVILARTCGKPVERGMVEVEALVSEELKALPLEDFIEVLPTLDAEIDKKVEDAREKGSVIWYLGTADLRMDEYRIGFEAVPLDDPLTMAKESDNILKVLLRDWRRPVTLVGPGAGAPETVAGLVAGLRSIAYRAQM